MKILASRRFTLRQSPARSWAWPFPAAAAEPAAAAGEPAMAQRPLAGSGSRGARHSLGDRWRRRARPISPAHIPGSVHSDYDKAGWRVTRNDVPFMLPSVPELEKLIGDLGIDENSHVVVVPAGVQLHRFRLGRARLLDAEGCRRAECLDSRRRRRRLESGGLAGRKRQRRRRRRKSSPPRSTRAARASSPTSRRSRSRRRDADRRAAGVVLRRQGEGAEGRRPMATFPARSMSTARVLRRQDQPAEAEGRARRDRHRASRPARR